MKIKAQSTIEFTFATIVIMFLIYGMVQIFRWAGMDLANRRVAQDGALTAGSDPDTQLSTNAGDSVLPLVAVYHGTITNGYGNANQ